MFVIGFITIYERFLTGFRPLNDQRCHVFALFRIFACLLTQVRGEHDPRVCGGGQERYSFDQRAEAVPRAEERLRRLTGLGMILKVMSEGIGFCFPMVAVFRRLHRSSVIGFA